jgi:FkbM family methyltransferase
VRRLEAGLPAEFRAVMLVSPAEAELYRRFAQPGRIEAIRNGVDLDYFQPEPAIEETNCVFVGALDYRPNVDGIVWFCREVWPGIQRRKPQTKLYLVGRRPSKAVQQLAQQPGVVLIGQVADVRPYVSRAAVVVVPLRLARGLQNKVLEALAQGKAVVASPPALAALETEAGVHLLTASAPVEWEAAVLRLLDDAELRQRLGTAGRRYVENHHAWQTCLQPFAELLGSPARNGQSGDMQAPYTGTTLKETIAVNVNGRSFRVVAGRNRDFWDQVAKGVWEPQTFAILEQFLDAHHAYIDMGSWIGPTLLYGCQLAKGAYGIEPDPVAYAELTENVAANRPLTDNVKLCQLCIAPKSGKTPFGSDREAGDSMSSLLFAHGKTRWIVDGQSFEDFIRQNNIRDCSLIKMDIEGGEYSVLPTMVPYLREFRPTLYLSIHPCFLGQPGKLGPVRTVARTMLRLAKTWKLLRCLSFYRYVYDGAGNPLTFWQLLRWSRHDVSHSFVATDREWRVIRTDCPNPPPPP